LLAFLDGVCCTATADGVAAGGAAVLEGPGVLRYADYTAYQSVGCLGDGRFSLACADTAEDGWHGTPPTPLDTHPA
jgi:hypothetical protein